MQTNEWLFEDGYCKLKTARQKKRLRIKDLHKYLRWLHRERSRLWKLQRELPLLPLELPYQKGWKRTFVLRHDVAASEKAPFYQALLNKINTVRYSHDKRFRMKAPLTRILHEEVYID